MATFNTIDDLLRIVRENEEYRVALRRELLTDDLLALPSQIAEILQTQNELRETQNKILAEQEKSRRTQNELRETQREMLGTQDSILKTQSEILRRLDNVEAHNRRLSDDFGNFRGSYAGIAVVKHAPGIAMRLDEAKSLGIDELTPRVLSSVI